MAYELSTIDEFLKHRASERMSSYLKNWKDNNPPEINVFLHTRRNPIVIWQHPFPKAFVRENKETKKPERLVYGGNYTCREDELVLKRQYFRKDDGTRKHPPTKCPMCRLVEHVRDLVEEEQMDWLTPIFRFNGDEESRVVHAGGLFGMFKDDLDDDQRKAAIAAGIKFKDAWQETSYAKCNYVFCVVDVANVQDGVQVATVTNMLGDRVKEVINDRCKSKGSEAGNPWLNPYCIQWEFLKHEAEIQKKYKARPMDIPLTGPIKALIYGEPPDLTGVIAPFNLQTMRAYLEQYALVQLDWKYIFDVPLLEDDREGRTVDPVAELPGETRMESGAVEDPDVCPECGKTEATGCPHEACTCGKPILPTDATCKHCGKVWIVAAIPPPPPAPVPATGRGRKRTAATPGGGKETGDPIPFK